MKPILIAGTTIVNLALISYSLFIFSERKAKKATIRVLSFLTIGVILDCTATICMIIGSSKSPFTIHGILGYSSLVGMLTDAVLIWKVRIREGVEAGISPAIHKYSLAAFCWWVAAYLTGALLVMLR
jgi:uncharacterized repeat protein (TIGR03987 family)